MQSLWGRDWCQTNALQVSHNTKVFHFLSSFNRGILIISILEYLKIPLKEENCVVNHSLQPGWPTVKQGAATARQVWDSTLEGSRLFTRYLLASCYIIVFLFCMYISGFPCFQFRKMPKLTHYALGDALTTILTINLDNQCWQPIKANNKDYQC